MILKRFLLMIFILLFMVTLVGCHEKDGQTEFLIYSKWTHYLAVVGLTESGKTQETIIIPTHLEGIPVNKIGDVLLSGRKEGFNSNYLKTLIIHPEHVTFSGIGGGGRNLETIIFSSYQPVIFFGYSSMSLRIYVPSKSVEHYIQSYEKSYVPNRGEHVSELDVYHYDILPANVSFMNNYSDDINGGYYRVMQVHPGSLLQQPEEPVRKGYEFKGWFKEQQCINPWDFKTTVTNEQGETILYAKWIKI